MGRCEERTVVSPRRVVGTSQQDISLAAEALVRGEVVISPTDTHYTLLASPAQEAGSARIYEIKKRDSDFPLTIFLSGPGLLDQVALVDDRVKALAEDLWPGGLTLILPKRRSKVPDYITAGLPTVAVACHRNPVFVELLQKIGGWGVCTSANLSGQGEQLVTFRQAANQLGDKVSLMVDGGPAVSDSGNTIVDLTGRTPLLVRAGRIALTDVRKHLPDLVDRTKDYKTRLKRRQQSVATWHPTLAGMTALVTGAARGRGSELVRVLAQSGVRTLVTDKSETGESVAEELIAQDFDVEFRVLDATDPVQWDDAVKHVLKKWGGLDLLINNAGYFESRQLDEVDRHDWQLSFAVNTSAAFYGIRAAAPYMGMHSSIVNVSSVFGKISRPYTGVAYETSKGALLPLTRSAARHLASSGIRVNAVCPGLIRTPMTEDLFVAGNHDVLAGIPLGRAVDIFDIIDAVCFLASPLSSYVTGTALHVDGGLLCL